MILALPRDRRISSLCESETTFHPYQSRRHRLVLLIEHWFNRQALMREVPAAWSTA